MPRYKLFALDEEGRVIPKFTRRNSSKKIIERIKEKMEKKYPFYQWKMKVM